MSHLFCEKCNSDQEYVTVEKKIEYKVKQEIFMINGFKSYCKYCGEKIFNLDLEQLNQNTAFNKYRIKHNLLHPEEIKSIRNMYNLTQIEFSILLGFDKQTIQRLERGSIQTIQQNEKIGLCKSIDYIKNLLDKKQESIPEQLKDKVLNIIPKLEKETVIQFDEENGLALVKTCSWAVARTLKKAGFSPIRRFKGIWIFSIPVEAISTSDELKKMIMK